LETSYEPAAYCLGFAYVRYLVCCALCPGGLVILMTTRKLYTPAELVNAQRALMHNGFHDFDPHDASAIIIALHKLGFRIVYVGKVAS
jgi:hypothetical protein